MSVNVCNKLDSLILIGFGSLSLIVRTVRDAVSEVTAC